MATTSRFRVDGMSCGHCVNSVRSEVSAVAGVLAVEVDLAAGQVTVTADGPVDAAAISAAVADAGYELIS